MWGKERGSKKSVGLKNRARACMYAPAGWCLVIMKQMVEVMSLIIERTETENCYCFFFF